MLVELQDAVGKVLLLFLAWRLVVPSSLPLSSSTPRLDGTSGVYGEDVAEDALGRGQVHFGGAGCFGIEAAKGWRIRQRCVEAGERRRGGTRFMNKRHKGLWSSEQLKNWREISNRPKMEREEERKREIVINQINVKIALSPSGSHELAEY